MSDPKRIIYRGVSMMEEWPQKIQDSQRILSYDIKGQSFPRIRYGEEARDWGGQIDSPATTVA